MTGIYCYNISSNNSDRNNNNPGKQRRWEMKKKQPSFFPESACLFVCLYFCLPVWLSPLWFVLSISSSFFSLSLSHSLFLFLLIPEASFGLRVLSLPASVCVCVSVRQSRACLRDNSSPVQATATKFRPEVKIPIVFGVEWAWYVRFYLFSKSCLFASLLRLWNICETWKKHKNGVCSTS